MDAKELKDELKKRGWDDNVFDNRGIGPLVYDVMDIVANHCKEIKLRRVKAGEVELLPCPHCGYPPYEASNENGLFIAKCYNCGTQMTQDRKDKLAGIWNQRIKANNRL